MQSEQRNKPAVGNQESMNTGDHCKDTSSQQLGIDEHSIPSQQPGIDEHSIPVSNQGSIFLSFFLFSLFTMPRPKKSRWGTPDIRVYYSGIPAVVPNTLSALETKALMYRARIEEITQKLTTGNLDIDTSDDRSPSPPPKYDSMGKRTNTRDQRKKEILLNERQNLIQRVQRMNPGFRPPADYRPMAIRKQKKIPIPIEKFS